MKRLGLNLIFVLLAITIVWASIPPYVPSYWIVGRIDDTTNDAGETISADGRTVVFYEDGDTYDVANVQTTISGNRFMLNAYYIWPIELTVGETYKLTVVQGDDGFGAGPIDVVISGYGFEEVLPTGYVSISDFYEFDDPGGVWDELVEAGIISEDGEILFDATEEELKEVLSETDLTQEEIEAIYDILEEASEESLTLEEDGGTSEEPESGGGETTVEEPEPEFKIWFGNRAYSSELVAKGRAFVVSAAPTLRVEISIEEPFSLASNIESYSIVIDPGSASARTLELNASHVAQKAYAAGASGDEDRISSCDLEYNMTGELDGGEHTFQFTAQSSGTHGTASTVTRLATVEVMGGPLRIIGLPLAYPNPFSISKQGTVTIQYELSQDANIEIYLVDPTGKRIKKMSFNSGSEGGSAGINKVTWNGRTEQGYLAGNAIYVGTILSRDEERLLAKVKLAIVD